MKKKTSKGADKVEPRPEEEQGLREEEEDRQPAREDTPRLRSEPYFPEVFLG